MTVKEMIYQFRLEANKIDSKQSQKLSLPSIVSFINRGQLQLMKTRYGSNNNYRATLEEIQKRIDEWQRLITPHFVLDGTADEDNKSYTFDLTKATDYCFLMRCTFVASKGSCSKKDIITTRLTQTDDLNIILDNPNSSSNFEWREINYRLAQDKIIAYTDPSFSFSIDQSKIDFLRYPADIDIAGYKHFDSTASQDRNCELPKFLHPEIVTEAVFLFKHALNSPDANAAGVLKATEE